jgi:hypothetical protein
MTTKQAYNFVDITGQVFHRWTVIKYDDTKPGKKAFWICRCECGTIKSIFGSNLRLGTTKSCGCLMLEVSKAPRNEYGFYANDDKVGLSFRRRYKMMLARCYNPKNKKYSQYGGRGITVCDRWLGEAGFDNYYADKYESFLHHIQKFGLKNTSFDRILVHGNYTQENTRWATPEQQGRNKQDSAPTVDYDEHMKWKKKLKSLVKGAVLSNSKSMRPNFKLVTGCDVLTFRKYIESQFLPGMTWENHGNGISKWNLDHIKRCREFDLSKPEDRLACFHFTNYQPLWWKDNMEKK